MDSMGQPYCSCQAGYEGDGQTACTVIPSEVRLSGSSEPAGETVFDNVDWENDAGGDPDITHNYEVTNMGIGTVRVHIKGVWPMAVYIFLK